MSLPTFCRFKVCSKYYVEKNQNKRYSPTEDIKSNQDIWFREECDT